MSTVGADRRSVAVPPRCVWIVCCSLVPQVEGGDRTMVQADQSPGSGIRPAPSPTSSDAANPDIDSQLTVIIEAAFNQEDGAAAFDE